MRFVTRTWIAVAVALCVVLGAPWAHADPLSKPDAPEARSHLALGNRLYGVRSFEEAAAQYKAGAIIEPAPVFDYNLGQCFRQLGKYQEAIWHYDRFLSRGRPQGELLDAVTGFIAQMKSEIDKKAMTQKPVEPGPTSAGMPSRGPERPAVVPHAQAPAREHSEPWYQDGLGWGLTGVGVVGVAVGGSLLINAASLNRDANANPNEQGKNRLHDQANTRNLLGSVFGVGGAGLLVVGIIKLAIHADTPSQPAGWDIVATTNGVMAVGRF
jgi:tetratricopeptide (TPR) repeat protein